FWLGNTPEETVGNTTGTCAMAEEMEEEKNEEKEAEGTEGLGQGQGQEGQMGAVAGAIRVEGVGLWAKRGPVGIPGAHDDQGAATGMRVEEEEPQARVGEVVGSGNGPGLGATVCSGVGDVGEEVTTRSVARSDCSGVVALSLPASEGGSVCTEG
ncbi:unnamed protein product, partial [Discosporangium mesarthrocarpum]